MRTLSNVTFGVDPESHAGPEDGRRTAIDDAGNVALWLNWSNPPGPPDFGGFSQGVFIARTGFRIAAELSGAKRTLRFPTIAERHYRVESATSLNPSAWEVSVDAIVGTGATMGIEVPADAGIGPRFLRVVRID